MKRSGPPKRTKGIHVNPETVRKFLNRGQQPLRRTGGPRRSSAPPERPEGTERGEGPARRPRRPRPPEGPLTFRAWAAAVYRLAGGRCEVTGVRIPKPRPINFHHVLPRQELRRRGLHHRCNDPANGILVTTYVHAQHEGAAERIPRDRLPERAERFARELGPWAEALLDRMYPRPAEPATDHPKEV